MGYYLQHDDVPGGGESLASITGWNDVTRWAESLKGSIQLQHLCRYGWCQNIPQLQKDIAVGLKEREPKPDVADTISNLLGLLKVAKRCVTVTDGMGVDDGTGDEGEE